MEKVATDIYTFSELREYGFVYVDKTDLLYAMASGESGKQCSWKNFKTHWRITE